MGGKQSYGQAISTINDKKAVIIGQVNVQTSFDHMTEITVVLGNEIHPQLWNVAIMEVRSTDIDFPLTYRRFCISDPVVDYNQQYIPKKINQFSSIQSPQKIQFHDKQGVFWMIQIPSYIIEQEQNDELIIYESRIHPLCEKMKRNKYREQYQQAYIELFNKIEQEVSCLSDYISIGILDMKQSNPILGIDNYSMTSDIIEAFIQCTPKIHKLIFISEIETQAFIMGIALKDKIGQIEAITQRFMGQEKQKEDQGTNQLYINEKIEQEIEFKQEENIQLNSDNRLQEPQNLIQKIQKPYMISYFNGHKQNIVYQFFRQFNTPLNQEVFQTIIPRVNNNENSLCLCGRKTIIRINAKLCCYCGLERSTFLECEQRACARQYCASCFNPTKLYNLCMQGHQMKFINEINEDLKCCYCRQITYRYGYYYCNICSFKVCASCYYSNYAQWQFQKMKIYLSYLKKIKPNLRQEVYFQLITEYLLDANLQKLRVQ
ncbi:unnamed protein product [Paramecium sonneborni]|uniref:Uncharacterized protein n=1 Tax=Paramecium sonneborni TaxID=65129 RepID=A0A8S1R6P9_9CILI|nr:unnamed protein product [Paramecium sonneborni]